MKNWTFTTLPVIAIALLTVLTILVWPKSPSDQKETSSEFVPLTPAKTPKRERVQEKQEDGPVMLHLNLRAEFGKQQASIQETVNSLNK